MIVAVNGLHAKAGGSFNYLYNILPALASLAGPDDTFVVFGPHELRSVIGACPPRIRYHPVACPSSAAAGYIWEQARLPGLVKQVGADVLFCPHNYVPLRCRKPTVLFLRNSLAAGRHGRGFYRRAYWWAISAVTKASLRRATRVLSVSQTVAQEIRQLYELDAGFHMTVVPHGVPPTFSPHPLGPHPLAARGGGPYFLFVSYIFPHKNLLGLVQAFGRIAAQIPEHRLAVVGGIVDPGYVAQVRQEATRMGVPERVVWVGPVAQKELPDWYRHAVALVYPSFAESFGNPPLEAMACGTAVLASRAGAMPEVCAEGADYFDPAKPDEIAALMLRVAGDPEFAEGLRRRGAARAGKFSLSASAALLLSSLRDAVARA